MNVPLSDKVVGKRGASLVKKWNPKDWKPEYEAMVALCAMGKSNKEVALLYSITESWLSSILNSEKGKLARELLVRNTRDAVVGDVTARLRDMQEKALSRMEKVLNDDKLAERSALAIFDRSAYFLKNMGVIKDSHAPPVATATAGNTVINQTNNTLVVSGKNADDLREGLKKADEVKLLHSSLVEKVG